MAVVTFALCIHVVTALTDPFNACHCKSLLFGYFRIFIILAYPLFDKHALHNTGCSSVHIVLFQLRLCSCLRGYNNFGELVCFYLTNCRRQEFPSKLSQALKRLQDATSQNATCCDVTALQLKIFTDMFQNLNR